MGSQWNSTPPTLKPPARSSSTLPTPTPPPSLSPTTAQSDLRDDEGDDYPSSGSFLCVVWIVLAIVNIVFSVCIFVVCCCVVGNKNKQPDTEDIQSDSDGEGI